LHLLWLFAAVNTPNFFGSDIFSTPYVPVMVIPSWFGLLVSPTSGCVVVVRLNKVVSDISYTLYVIIVMPS
jgi:hypothetical protein